MNYYPFFFLLFLAFGKHIFKDQTNYFKGLEPQTNFYTETGFISIDSDDNQLFYQLFLQEGIESFDDITQDQFFILWLNGGPGCASQMHIYQNVGPYYLILQGEEQKIKKSDSAWSKLAHTLFIDQPYNVGFSYGEEVNDTKTAAENMVDFLLQFFKARPQLAKTKFYAFGVSYGGHYIPGLGAQILQNAELMDLINFQGIGVGNGWTDPFNQFESLPSLFQSLGVMSENKNKEAQNILNEGAQYVLDQDYSKATQVGFAGMFEIMINFTGKMSPYSFQDYDIDMETENPIAIFINKQKQQYEAQKSQDFQECNWKVTEYFEKDISEEQKSNVELLLKSNKRVLLYNGSIDVVCNTPGVTSYINTLKWDKIYDWKKSNKNIWTAINPETGKVETAGTIKKFDNLYYATVYRAGHMTPRSLPIASLNMLNYFLNDIEWL